MDQQTAVALGWHSKIFIFIINNMGNYPQSSENIINKKIDCCNILPIGIQHYWTDLWSSYFPLLTSIIWNNFKGNMSPLCSLHNSDSKTIVHLFYVCGYILDFWTQCQSNQILNSSVMIYNSQLLSPQIQKGIQIVKLFLYNENLPNKKQKHKLVFVDMVRYANFWNT